MSSMPWCGSPGRKASSHSGGYGQVRGQGSQGPPQPLPHSPLPLQGCVPTMARAVVVNAAQLASYSQSKQFLLDSGKFPLPSWPPP